MLRVGGHPLGEWRDLSRNPVTAIKPGPEVVPDEDNMDRIAFAQAIVQVEEARNSRLENAPGKH